MLGNGESIISGLSKKMSYDISLLDPITKKVLHAPAPHQLFGGTHAVDGTTELWLNVTYNYSKHFYRTIDNAKGIRFIYGMTGAESIPVMKKAIDQLKDDVSDNYWEATEGNAKRALLGLLALAQMRPDGVWNGD